MQNILLKFGMCHLVALDDFTTFKAVFIAVCEALNLNHDFLVKLNHKGLTIEYFHRFLNKSSTIATKERGIDEIFVPAGVIDSYAWNNAQIDGTDILCNILAIGQELHFPIDISLNTLPKLTQNNGQVELYYLKGTDFFVMFPLLSLKSYWGSSHCSR